MTSARDDDHDLGEHLAEAQREQPSTTASTDARTGRAAAAQRISQQQSWVDHQLRVAMERGDFDDLPGAGKPIRDLGSGHDPDWWLKRLIEREKLSVLPASLQLRKDDAELDGRLDGLLVESEARREVEDFNARVIRARYTPADGTPPLITMPRDVDATLGAWRTRRQERLAARTAQREDEARAADAARLARRSRRPWRRWARRRGRD